MLAGRFSVTREPGLMLNRPAGRVQHKHHLTTIRQWDEESGLWDSGSGQVNSELNKPVSGSGCVRA